MTSYNLQTKHLRANAPGVLRWCLDFPQPDKAIDLERLRTGVLFQGWILLQDGYKLAQMYLRQGEQTCVFDLTVSRADVIDKVLKQPSTEHSQLQCGFSQSIALQHDQVILGFIVDGQQYDFVELNIDSSMKVLQGTAPWLFLDNDTNQSVAQFTGKLSLSMQVLEGWRSYVDSLALLPMDNNKMAVLIAPNKEQVYAQYYPHKAAEKTPVQQLLDYVDANPLILYPATELATMSERSFRYTDTHWTHQAAMKVSVLLAQKFGLDIEQVTAKFAADQYVERSVCGDLGNKLFPPRAANEMLLTGVNYKQYLRYDNGLPNFGRVMLFENTAALSNQHCLIFGASSSYSMLNYLVRLYARISIVHTAGNVDPKVIVALAPDNVICQTNERFIIRAPIAHYSLADTLQDKLSDMTPAQISDLQQASANCSGAIDHHYFHSLLAKG